MIQAMLDYQQTDERLREIELELSRSEERNKLATAKKFLDVAPDRFDKLEGRAGELLALLEGFNKKYEEVVEQLKYIESESSDIDAIIYNKKSAEKLQDTLKEIKQSVEPIKLEMQQIADNFTKLKSQTILMQRQFKEFKEKYAELKKEKAAQIEKVKAELEVLAKNIQPALLEKYKRKREDKMFPILYEINGEQCRQCSMGLSVSDLSNLKKDKMIECENCRRIIFTKE